MPLTKEFRIFFLHGKPLLTVEYWEEGEYRDELRLLRSFDSRHSDKTGIVEAHFVYHL